MSTPNVTTEPVPEKLSVELAPDMKRWLELEALRVKHALGLARREYRQRREQEQGQ